MIKVMQLLMKSLIILFCKLFIVWKKYRLSTFLSLSSETLVSISISFYILNVQYVKCWLNLV